MRCGARVGLALSLVFSFVVTGVVGAQSWEPIRRDYGNVRGMNHVSAAATNPDTFWSRYDGAAIDREFGFAKQIGLNVLRVWLSHRAYEQDPTSFVRDLSDYAQRAAARRLYIMPVLWDGFGQEPMAGPIDPNVWRLSPGTTLANDPRFKPRADAYLTAVVGALKTSPALLMWDIMNEPDPAVDRFVDDAIATVKRLDPMHPVTVGYAAAEGMARTVAQVDVLSFHIYAALRTTFTKAHAIAAGHANRTGKPVVVSETAAPGWGMAYQDHGRFVEDLGLGFIAFDLMVGRDLFKETTGIFYADGEIRDAAAAAYYQSLAVRQGVQVNATFTVKARNDPAYVHQQPLPLGWETLHTFQAVFGHRPNRSLLQHWPMAKTLYSWLIKSLYDAGAIDDTERGRAQAWFLAADRAVTRNDLLAYRTNLDALNAQVRVWLLDRGHDRYSARLYGAATVVPQSRGVPWVGLHGIAASEDHIELIVGGVDPTREFAIVLAGATAASNNVPYAGGTLTLLVDPIINIEAMQPDTAWDVFRFRMDLDQFQGYAATVRMQVACIAFDRSWIRCSRGIEIDVLATRP